MDSSVRVGKIAALLNPLTFAIMNIAIVAIIWFGGLRVNAGSLSQGQIIAFVNYMTQILLALVVVANLVVIFTKASASAARINEVLETQPAIADRAQDRMPAPYHGPKIQFQDVSFSYPDAEEASLSHISAEMLPGQTIGIIGGTGSGKSTLVNLIPRFYDPQEGTVRLNGEDVKQVSRATLCAQVGVVQQRAVLFQGSIRDNLRWGNENASDQELWEALSAAQAKEVVEGKPGQLDFQLEQGGRNLSGGQKQRLSIARALVKKPEILILDDSSSALDFATDAALRKSIKHLGYPVTTFLVSQRIACIQQADQILVLDNGHLAGCGTHQALLESCPLYQEIFDSQFPGERLASKEAGQK